MIKLVGNGRYHLIETRNGAKVLTLTDNYYEKSSYSLIITIGVIEMRVRNQKPHDAICTLAAGKYRLYEVKCESDLKDHKHLELCVAEGFWQGYLLPEGFPTERKTIKRITPTKELITKTMH